MCCNKPFVTMPDNLLSTDIYNIQIIYKDKTNKGKTWGEKTAVTVQLLVIENFLNTLLKSN